MKAPALSGAFCIIAHLILIEGTLFGFFIVLYL
jgi:hypothetical protein